MRQKPAEVLQDPRGLDLTEGHMLPASLQCFCLPLGPEKVTPSAPWPCRLAFLSLSIKSPFLFSLLHPQIAVLYPTTLLSTILPTHLLSSPAIWPFLLCKSICFTSPFYTGDTTPCPFVLELQAFWKGSPLESLLQLGSYFTNLYFRTSWF